MVCRASLSTHALFLFPINFSIYFIHFSRVAPSGRPCELPDRRVDGNVCRASLIWLPVERFSREPTSVTRREPLSRRTSRYPCISRREEMPTDRRLRSAVPSITAVVNRTWKRYSTGCPYRHRDTDTRVSRWPRRAARRCTGLSSMRERYPVPTGNRVLIDVSNRHRVPIRSVETLKSAGTARKAERTPERGGLVRR